MNLKVSVIEMHKKSVNYLSLVIQLRLEAVYCSSMNIILNEFTGKIFYYIYEHKHGFVLNGNLLTVCYALVQY